MAPKRTRKKVVGTMVTTTRKVVEETLTVSVEGDDDEANGEKGVEIESVPLSPTKAKEKQKAAEAVVKNKRDVGAKKKKSDDEKKKQAAPAAEEKEEEPAARKRKRKKRGSRNASAGEVSGNYKRYVYRVLKQVHPELGVSAMAMAVIDAMMRDMFERIAEEAARLSAYTRKATLSSREIQGAVQLVLPGELGKHAVAEGTKAVTNYVTAG